MKKILIALVMIIFLTACDNDLMNTPTKRVEAMLNNYVTLDSEVLKDFCNVDKNPELMRTFKGAGYILYALKIIIPILLIILGSIDIFQAVISQDEKQLSKSIMKLVQRVIAGVIIFFIPTIINYVFDMVDTNATSRYQGCYECLLDYHNCPEIPKIGG